MGLSAESWLRIAREAAVEFAPEATRQRRPFCPDALPLDAPSASVWKLKRRGAPKFQYWLLAFEPKFDVWSTYAGVLADGTFVGFRSDPSGRRVSLTPGAAPHNAIEYSEARLRECFTDPLKR